MATRRPDKPEGGTLDLFAGVATLPASTAPIAPPTPSVPTPAVPVTEAPEEPRTYRVAEIVRLASRALEARFGDVWIEGEVSGYRAQPSGHAYFALKDADAVLAAVMFRSSLARLRFRLVDGLQVRARGRLSIYEGSGKFQLVVEALEPAGLGALQLAFEQLKRKLDSEGLFAAERKRPLPFLARRIGVVTSASGAAVRDIIRVAARRGPARLLLAPCTVQGDAAAEDIVRALRALQGVGDVDVIIVGRGGGSLEDLAAFNDERVARAIAACRVPVVSAVGHEVDFTIADFVADRRAATPSQAAEMCVPVHDELLRELADLAQRLARRGLRATSESRQRLDEAGFDLRAAMRASSAGSRAVLAELASRLAAEHPRARLARDRAALVALGHRLERPLVERLARGRRTLEPLDRHLHTVLGLRVGEARRQLEALPPRLLAAVGRSTAAARHGLDALMGSLHALSPLRVLDRGYALVRDADGHVVASAESLAPGQRLALRFARGEARATVDEVGGDGAASAASPATGPAGRPGRGGGAR